MTFRSSNPFFGLVLVGGQSSRMGRSKADLVYHGGPQALVCRSLLASVCERVFFSGPEIRTAFGPDWILDACPESFGPLTGILSAMKVHPKASWVVLAVDMPFFDQKALQFLVMHRDASKVATAFICPETSLPEPLCAIYEPESLKLLLEAREMKRNCPRAILKSLDIAGLAPLDPKWVANANTPEEYQHALSGPKKVRLHYFASLKEERGLAQEEMETLAPTAAHLYEQLRERFGFSLPQNSLRVAVNNELKAWNIVLCSGDDVVFLPPVSGG